MEMCIAMVRIDEEKFTHQCQTVGDLSNENTDGLDALRLAEFIAAILFEAPLVFLVGETVLHVGSELLRKDLERQRVGGLGDRLVGLSRDVVRHILLFRTLFLPHLDECLPSAIRFLMGL